MKIESNKLILQNKEIKFEATIKKIIEAKNIIIVHLLNGNGLNFNIKQPEDNVYAVDIDGNIIWNIGDLLRKIGHMKKKCVISIGLNYKNNLIVNDHGGGHYEIDISKGEAIGESVSEW